MSLQVLLVLAVGAFMAYVNGANDVSKGIATLVGSGVTDYRRAIHWGTAWTAIGGLAGSVFAGAMVTTFGKGLLAGETTPTFTAALAIMCGAAAWVLVATRTGLPISTTHAIVGSLAGVAMVAYGTGGVRWGPLAGKVVLPLLLSPVVSMLLTVTLLRTARALAGRSETGSDCLCAEVEMEPAVVVAAQRTSGGLHTSALPSAARLHLATGTTEACAAERPAALRLTLDHLHWLTSGAASLARAMNDAPKMVAVILAASALVTGPRVAPWHAFAVVTAGMVAGSLTGGRRVTHVLAERITPMDHREGFVANLVTSVLVTAGALGGLPMSTTHVSSTGIMGAGATKKSGALNPRTVRDVLLAWVVTLPAAAVLGIVAYTAAKCISG